jgi:hypothetical protein
MTMRCKKFPIKFKINYFIKVGNHYFKKMKKSLLHKKYYVCVKVIIIRKFFCLKIEIIAISAFSVVFSFVLIKIYFL